MSADPITARDSLGRPNQASAIARKRGAGSGVRRPPPLQRRNPEAELSGLLAYDTRVAKRIVVRR